MKRATHLPLLSTSGWQVYRHPGTGNPQDGNWRLVFHGEETDARAHFRDLFKNIRQGGIRLLDEDGVIIKEYHAPRLRTRW